MPGRRARALPAVAALGTVLAATAHAAPAPPVALAGTTVVTSSRTASVAVRLPRAADVDVGTGLTVEVPRGRVAAVALKKVGAWSAPVLYTTHVGYCATAGCRTDFPRFHLAYVWAPGSADGRRARLPAGDYRLYVVTDGGPVTATIRFGGLSGRTTITPRAPAAGWVRSAAPTVAEPASGPLAFAGGGGHATAARGGLHATTVWKDLATAAPPAAAGLCSYAGSPPAGPAPAYQTPCSNGRGGLPPDVSSVQPRDAGSATPGRFVSGISGGWLLPPGTWSIGGYHNGAGAVTGAYVHQLWLDF